MRTLNHAENRNIKPAGSWLVTFKKIASMVRGAGANVVDGLDSWCIDIGTDGLALQLSRLLEI